MDLKLNKIREDRIAREKARIDKLREMNIKKYKKEDFVPPLKNSKSNSSLLSKDHSSTKSGPATARNFQTSNLPKQTNNVRPVPSAPKNVANPKRNSTITAKVNSFAKPANTRVSTAMNTDETRLAPVRNSELKPANKVVVEKKNHGKLSMIDEKGSASKEQGDVATAEVIKKEPLQEIRKPFALPKDLFNKFSPSKNNKSTIKNSISTVQTTLTTRIEPKKTVRKSLAPIPTTNNKPASTSRKSMLPITKSESSMDNSKKESVFDRLYKNKTVPKKVEPNNDALKLKNDPKYREKIINRADLIANPKRHTVFEVKPTKPIHQVRRSISAVHFKRIAKNELPNCIHKWASITELDKQDVTLKNEDAGIRQDKVVSAVKSERKRVTFQKPYSLQLNTPRPDEMQARLKSWLAKRGKSMDKYHHLQCFGLHHLAQSEKEFKSYDDENKENVSLEHDSDNDSFHESMNNKVEVDMKWRRASCISSADLDETKETILSEEVVGHHVDDLVVGALNDLTDLLREGFDWEQSARWLRAIRERFQWASDTAAYWECRAALEESQGNLPASVQCWEEAIAKGTERSVVEANLDQLLDKFMQLKISPKSMKEQGREQKESNTRMVDVKNVFKSTIIRFAVQQAKLRQSEQQDPVRYNITPVRRSGRVSCSSLRKTPVGRRTPLVQICSSIRQIDSQLDGKSIFVPNGFLPNTP